MPIEKTTPPVHVNRGSLLYIARVPGKEVVQFYMQSPYTDYDRANGIEKSAVKLVGFVKTGELAAGASQTVQYAVPKAEMRTYDTFGTGTYIVDAGDYVFAAGKDVHDAMNNILAAQGYTVADGMTAEGNAALTGTIRQEQQDNTTYAQGKGGSAIVNRFSAADLRNYLPDTVYLTRSDWTGTFPGAAADMEATQQMIADIAYPAVTAAQLDESGAVMPKTGAANGLLLSSMIYRDEDGILCKLDYDDPTWDRLLDQMTPEEMLQLYTVGGYGTIYVPSVGKPASIDRDGPATLNAAIYLAVLAVMFALVFLVLTIV